MEALKRKISLEDSTDRGYNSPTWGLLTATTFNIKVMLTQNMDDMGLFTDIVYLPLTTPTVTPPDYSILIDKLKTSGYTFPFMFGILPSPFTGLTATDKIDLRLPSYTASSYYNYGNMPITASTESKIDDTRAYNANVPYKLGFNTNTSTYTSYTNTIINGVSRVAILGEPKVYVFDTPDDVNLGTLNQIWGLQYQDFTGKTRVVTSNGVTNTIPVTNVRYRGEGWNETNISLSAITKEEYLFGIVSPPEVESDVFIDRGATSISEMHLRLSEIKDLDELVRYGNGFYNITKQ